MTVATSALRFIGVLALLTEKRIQPVCCCVLGTKLQCRRSFHDLDSVLPGETLWLDRLDRRDEPSTWDRVFPCRFSRSIACTPCGCPGSSRNCTDLQSNPKRLPTLNFIHVIFVEFVRITKCNNIKPIIPNLAASCHQK